MDSRGGCLCYIKRDGTTASYRQNFLPANEVMMVDSTRIRSPLLLGSPAWSILRNIEPAPLNWAEPSDLVVLRRWFDTIVQDDRFCDEIVRRYAKLT
jgi:hypothetical protein